MSLWELDDTYDDDEPMFCPCGVTLMGDPGESDGLCVACANQPHPGRDADGYPSCRCDECETYWDGFSA